MTLVFVESLLRLIIGFLARVDDLFSERALERLELAIKLGSTRLDFTRACGQQFVLLVGVALVDGSQFLLLLLVAG